MLDDALTHAQRKVKPAKLHIPLLEVFNDSQGMQIVIKTQPVRLHCHVQGAFPGVTKGRMSNVVDQRQRFGQILVQPKRGCDSTGNLRDFHGMRQSAAEVVRVAMSKNLRLAGKTAKGPRMNDAPTIPLKGGTVGMGPFRIYTSCKRCAFRAINGATGRQAQHAQGFAAGGIDDSFASRTRALSSFF